MTDAEAELTFSEVLGYAFVVSFCAFFALQCALSHWLLLRRVCAGRGARGARGGKPNPVCAGMEHSEFSHDRRPSLTMQTSLIAPDKSTAEGRGHEPAPLPLRFSISLVLSGTVVLLLAVTAYVGCWNADTLLRERSADLLSKLDTGIALVDSLGVEYEFVLSTLKTMREWVLTLEANTWALVPAVATGVTLAVLNEVMWKVVCVRRVLALAQLSQAEREQRFERFDFYWSFYFVSFACANSAISFVVVAAFLSLLFFSMFAPFLFKSLWLSWLLGAGITSLAAGWLLRFFLFRGLIATHTTVRYQRLFRFYDLFYSFTIGPVSATTTVLLRYLLLVFCTLSSLARLDEPLVPPEFKFYQLDVYEPGYATYGGMLKTHWLNNGAPCAPPTETHT